MRSPQPARQNYTMHFDLRHVPSGQELALHAGGRQYPLTPHSPQTLAAARAHSPATSRVPEGQLTHFASAVALPTHNVMSYWTYARNPGAPADQRIMANFGLHAPDHGRPAPAAAVSTAGAGASPAQNPVEVDLSVVSGWEKVALSILFNHPEIMNLRTDATDPDQDIANIIIQHILGSPYFADFTQAVQSQGQQSSPGTQDGFGWMQNVTDSQGNIVYFTQGPLKGTARQYLVCSPTTRLAMARPLKYIMQDVKNDPKLYGWNWRVHNGVTNVALSPPPSSSSAGPAGIRALSSSLGAADSDVLNVTATKIGHQFGVNLDLKTTTTTDRSFDFDITNYFLRYVSTYIQFYDENNNLIDPDLEYLFTDATLQNDVDTATLPPGAPVSQNVATAFQNNGKALSADAIIQQNLTAPADVQQKYAPGAPLKVVAGVARVMDSTGNYEIGFCILSSQARRGFKRTVAFAMDDDPAAIAEHVCETMED